MLKYLSVAICLILLTGCYLGRDSNWEVRKNLADRPTFNFAVLSSKKEEVGRSLQLEIFRDYYGQRLYLDGAPYPFPCDSDQRTTRICLIFPEGRRVIKTTRLKGGYRLYVPDDAAEEIISHLLSCQIVQIQVGRYHSTFTPVDFKNAYQSLSAIASESYP